MTTSEGGFGGSDSGSLGTSSTDGSSGIPSSGTGGSDSASAGTGGQATGNGSNGNESYNGKINPAWEPVLKVIPEQMHGLVTPHLRKWDDNYRNLQQQYTPWKQNFVDKGMTAEQMNNAAAIYQQINNGPEEFYRRLGNALGVTPQQAEQIVEDELEGDSDEDEQIPPAIQQQFQALQEQNTQLLQMYQQRDHEQQVNQYQQQIDREIQQIKTQNPNVDVNDLMGRYLNQINRAEKDRNVNPSLQSAYAEQQAFIENQMAARGYRVPAPNVINPGGGGMPPTGQTQKPVTQDQRISAVANMMNMRQRQQ